MGRLIGEVYVAVLADASRFRPDADAKLKAAMAGARTRVPVDADTGPADKKIAALAAALKGLNGRVSLDTRGVAAAAAAAAGLRKIAQGQSVLIAGGTGWGVLNTKIRLFGGALDAVLPKWARAISLWHLGADAIFEFAAAWTPAIIAMGAFVAVAAPIADKIKDQWVNINTVIHATGTTVLPNTGKGFQALQKAIEPQVLTAFGEALMIVNGGTGTLSDALQKVGKVVDLWGANLVRWSDKARNSFSNIVSAGAKDLAAIGYGFQQVFRIIGTVFRDMPGYVHILLIVGDAFLTLTANVVQLASPLIRAGLALHGFLVYVGLAVTAVVALGRAMAAGAIVGYMRAFGISAAAAGTQAEAASGRFSKFGQAIGNFGGFLIGGTVRTFQYGRSLLNIARGAESVGGKSGIAAAGVKLLKDGLAVIPFGAVGLGAAAAAVVIGTLLYFSLKRGSDAATQFGKSMQSLIASSTVANIAAHVADAISQTAVRYKQATSSANTYNKSLFVSADFHGILANRITSLNRTQQEYKQQLDTIIGQTDTYGQRMNQLTGLFGNNAGALAALNLLGIKAGDIATETNATWQTQITELTALSKGYGYMGTQAGAAGAQLNTLNIASGDTTKNIQALVSAEGAWISMITGGQTAFANFELGLSALSSSLGSTAKNANTVTVRIGKIRQEFPALGASMVGTSQASLAVQQAFSQQVTSAATLYGSLQTLAAASGNTKNAQQSLAIAGKDIIAQLLPFAAGSRQATAEVSALAQILGGPATDNFQVLAKWVGNTTGAEKSLYDQQVKLTISAANLTVAAKNLGNALNTDITAAQAAAITQTSGLTRATQDLAHAAVTAHGQITKDTALYAGAYFGALRSVGLGTQDATQYLNAYLGRLGYGQTVIAEIDSALGSSRQAFEKSASQFGLTKDAADKLWDSLHKLAADSPYAVAVTDTLTGGGSISVTQNGQTVALSTQANSLRQNKSALHAAAGWQVPPGLSPAGQDGYHAVLAPGELVVPASHAPKYAAMAKRDGIPGLAGGGFIPGSTALAGQARRSVQDTINGVENFNVSVVSKAVQAVVQAAINNAAASLLGGPFTGTASGSGFANALAIAQYLMANGFNQAGAAGVASVIFGESGANPEALQAGGGGGWGLIQWTGNTVGLPSGYTGPTGNLQYDMAQQLLGTLGYIAARGGRGLINSAGSPVLAGDVFSGMEAPLVPLSDTRPGLAMQLYALLGGQGSTAGAAATQRALQINKQTNIRSAGGFINEPVYGFGKYSGMPYSFAEKGYPEQVIPGGASTAAGGQGMPSITRYQGETIIHALHLMVALLRQAPSQQARAFNAGSSQGVHHGYYSAGH